MSMWFAVAALVFAYALVAAGVGIATGRVVAFRDTQVLTRALRRCECDGPGPVTDMHRPYCPVSNGEST